MSFSYSSLFIAGAANGNTGHRNVFWIRNNLTQFVVYSIHDLIAVVIMDTSVHNSYGRYGFYHPLGKIICTLRGHQGAIKVMSYVVFNNKTFLFTCGDDCCLRVWSHEESDALDSWIDSQVFSDLLTPGIAISSTVIDKIIIVASACSTGHINIYESDLRSSNLRFSHTIKLPSAQMANQLLVNEIPSLSNKLNTAILFVGGVDSRIHLFIKSYDKFHKNNTQETFTSVGILSGHDEWISSLSAMLVDEKTLMLASGSKDAKIRVWKIKSYIDTSGDSTIKDMNEIDAQETAQSTIIPITVNGPNAFDSVDQDEGDDIDDESNHKEVFSADADEEDILSNSEARLQFLVYDVRYSVYLESVLIGHEDWITSVNWFQPIVSNSDNVANNQVDELRLFSTSMDRNMVIWTPSQESGGIWCPITRMGDIGGALGGSIGGNLLGFVDSCLSPDGTMLIAVGYGGSFHLWSCKNSIHSEFSYEQQSIARWHPIPFISGHFGCVNDISWSSDFCGSSSSLISVSSDQTCRMFSEIKSHQNELSNSWVELSRPQIHGYDLTCIAIPQNTSIIITGGDEKLIRVFDAPQTVLIGLEKLCGQTLRKNSAVQAVSRAYIPELGLSNKAIESMSVSEMKEQESRQVVSLDWTKAPLESQLADYTIWPEIKKLFGHNYDLLCLSISPSGLYLASSSKSRDSSSAMLLLWYTGDQQNMDLIGKLGGHDSSVVCISFSPNNRYLASSGKDRALCVYKCIDPLDVQHYSSTNKTCPFQLTNSIKGAHKRIVWDLRWTPDSSYLITASRDGFCKIWLVKELHSDNHENASLPEITLFYSLQPFQNCSPVTAIDIGPVKIPVISPASQSIVNSWVVIFGSESGDMNLYSLQLSNNNDETAANKNTAEYLFSIPSNYSHSSTVKRIKWRPNVNILKNDSSPNTASISFASCGEDHTIRIHQIDFFNL
eukprot:gene4240-6019_t